jgi:hypothetical protein
MRSVRRSGAPGRRRGDPGVGPEVLLTRPHAGTDAPAEVRRSSSVIGYPGLLAQIGDRRCAFVAASCPLRRGRRRRHRRNCAYGRGLARAFGRAIAAAGWALCSGLARESMRGPPPHSRRGRGWGAGVWAMSSVPEHAALMAARRVGGRLTEYRRNRPARWRFHRGTDHLRLNRAVVWWGAGDWRGWSPPPGGGTGAVFGPGDVDRESSVSCNLRSATGDPHSGADDLIGAGPRARTTASPHPEAQCRSPIRASPSRPCGRLRLDGRVHRLARTGELSGRHPGGGRQNIPSRLKSGPDLPMWWRGISITPYL